MKATNVMSKGLDHWTPGGSWPVDELGIRMELFACPSCPRVYRSRTALSLHQRVECGKEPSKQCVVCARRFYHGGDLRRHLRTVHKEDVPNTNTAAVRHQVK